MAEKVVSELKELNLGSNELDEELPFGKLFLQALCDKVGQFDQISIVASEGSRRLLFFSIEIPKIYSENLDFPNKVIKLIDDLTATYFLRRNQKIFLFSIGVRNIYFFLFFLIKDK